MVVPDSLRAAVIKSSKYEVVINDDFADFADHYGCRVIPAWAYHNKPSEPTAGFKEVLMDNNSTWGEIRILLNAIIYRISYFPFCNSIHPIDRDRDNSRSNQFRKLANFSQVRYLVNVKKVLGYTSSQTLNCGFAFIEALMQEYVYLCNERKKLSKEIKKQKKTENG